MWSTARLLVGGIFAVALIAIFTTLYTGHTAASPGLFLSQHGVRIPLRSDLGLLHVPVVTTSRLAQRYFDQGIRLLVAFAFPLAAESFRAAQDIDPACALCVWGEAFALSRNLNDPMNSTLAPRVFALSERALQLAQHAQASCPSEQAELCMRDSRICAAAVVRIAPTAAEYEGSLVNLTARYAHAMAALAPLFPADPTIALLAADAIMNLSPWDYWLPGGAALRPQVRPARDLLQGVLRDWPDHPGAIHWYIHLMEAGNEAGLTGRAAPE